MHDALDVKATVVGDEVYADGAFVGPLDEDMHVGGEGLLGVVVLLFEVNVSSKLTSNYSVRHPYLFPHILAISRSNRILRRHFDVASICLPLIDRLT